MKIISVMSACITDKILKTRAKHQCFGCCKKFESGKKMRFIKCVGDDGWWQGYFCRPCSMAYDRIDWHEMEGISWGDLVQDYKYQEFLQNYPEFQ